MVRFEELRSGDVVTLDLGGRRARCVLSRRLAIGWMAETFGGGKVKLVCTKKNFMKGKRP